MEYGFGASVDLCIYQYHNQTFSELEFRLGSLKVSHGQNLVCNPNPFYRTTKIWL